jgi:hypothetical protein
VFKTRPKEKGSYERFLTLIPLVYEYVPAYMYLCMLCTLKVPIYSTLRTLAHVSIGTYNLIIITLATQKQFIRRLCALN